MITFAPEEHGPSERDTGSGPWRRDGAHITSRYGDPWHGTRGERVRKLWTTFGTGVRNIIDIRNRSNWTLGLFTTISTSQFQCIQSSLACMWGASVCHMVHTLDTEHHKAGAGHKPSVLRTWGKGEQWNIETGCVENIYFVAALNCTTLI